MKALINNIEWKNDEVVIYGKRIVTKRKMAWYGDKAFEYKYSNISRTALVWTEELLALKAIVESHTAESYNSCLLNLYHDGNEGMGWHSDDEKVLKKDGAIASLSLGADRKFGFKHKQDKQSLYLTLEHGSLLLMKEQVQSHWLHSLPKTSKVLKPRINLTFRTIV
jgi:alkylated DNA repair dioxygenase AlkB